MEALLDTHQVHFRNLEPLAKLFTPERWKKKFIDRCSFAAKIKN